MPIAIGGDVGIQRQYEGALALGEGFVYVSAPLPAGSGLGTGIVGLKARNGSLVAARYALPGRRAPEPPAGLESYRWLPAVGEDGYWVMDLDL